MADTVKREFDIEPSLIRGGGGIFDVEVDGKLIFSKHQTGRFPEPQEVVDRIAALTSKR